jgi:hypothetical protein
MTDLNQGQDPNLWAILRGISSHTWWRMMAFALLGATPGIAVAFALSMLIGDPQHPTVVYMALCAVFWTSISMLLMTVIEVGLRLSEIRRSQSFQDHMR